MDGSRFDAFSRMIGRQRTRRGMLQAVGAAALGAMGFAGVNGVATARQATPAPSPAEAAQPTAIVVVATNDPLRVPGSDGSDHLEYDLIVTNAFVAPVTLTAIEVIAPDGETVLRLDGDALVTVTQPLLGQSPVKEIPASGTVGVVMDVVVPHGKPLDRLSHRITYAVAPDAPERSLIGAFMVRGPELTVDPRVATVIAPPMHGDGWVVFNGCCPPNGHRSIRIAIGGNRFAKEETFAIDWVQLRDGKLFTSHGEQNEQWFGFGADVLAVATGTVVATRDGVPEETPNQPVQHVKQPADYGGNSISIAIAPGVWAFYAHLQSGSITVKMGDTVQAGQVLGKLGNSGNTTAPHLHFGLQDGPDAATANSLPMVFDRYTSMGTINLEAAMEAATASIEPAGAAATPATPEAAALTLRPEGSPETQTATLPLDLVVVDFR